VVAAPPVAPQNGRIWLVRILAVADLHYRLKHWDWLVQAAEGVDVVAIAGDLADVASPVPVEVQSVVLGEYLDRIAAQAVVLAASGNHDLDGPGEHGEQVAGWLRRPRGASIVTDGASVDVDGTRFTVCPWWDGPHSRQAVEAQLGAAAVDRPDRWVWVYHSPPAGTVLCRDGRREFPDHELAGWIAQHEPDLVLCGHIHQAPWVDGGSWQARLGRTHVFNPGRQPGPVPPHVVLDTDTSTAQWYGVYDSETVAIP
jgi:Icc-related predicted phosphoesterase